MRIDTFNDGVSRERIPSNILNLLDQSVPNSSTGRSINFVGFVTCKDNLALFLPKGMSSKEYRTEAKLLYECFSKYERTEKIGSKKKVNSDITLPFGIKILENYIENGLYPVVERDLRRRFGGKVSWPRTIKTVEPVLNKSNIPIYSPPITCRRATTPNVIVKIHKAIICEADQQIGWLVSRTGSLIAPQYAGLALDVSISKAIALLRNELLRQFEDKKITQLKLMIDYLQQKFMQADRSTWHMGTTNFQVLWERICATVYGDQLQKFPIPAIPAYQTSSGRISRPENTSRPDIVISEGQKIAIIDAKYYDFSKSKPSWSDMVKQFFYAKAYSLKYPSKKVDNIFAVPKVEIDDAKEVVVIDDHSKLLNAEFPPIKIIYLNVTDAINLYNKRRKNTDLRADALTIQQVI